LFGTPNPCPFVKDAFRDYIIGGRHEAVNPEKTGTRAAALYPLTVQPGQSTTVRLRLCRASGSGRQADSFYKDITPPGIDEDRQNIMRQALAAGMLWTKQYYYWPACSMRSVF
jgi:hypothetical protein